MGFLTFAKKYSEIWLQKNIQKVDETLNRCTLLLVEVKVYEYGVLWQRSMAIATVYALALFQIRKGKLSVI